MSREVRRRQSGFTLIELLLVVGMIGVMGTGALLSFGRMLRAGRLEQGTEVLKGALREAQVHAFEDGNLWRIYLMSANLLYLEKSTNPSAVANGCGGLPGEWSLVRHYELPQGVTFGLQRSTDCIIFGQAGRVVSKAPYVIPPDDDHPPTDLVAIPLLTDGRRLRDTDLPDVSDPRDASTGIVAWHISYMPDLQIDLREERFLKNLCISLFSARSHQFGYPEQIEVRMSTVDPPIWSTPPLTFAGPRDPVDDAHATHCVEVVLNQKARHLQVRLSGARPGTRYWAFDEIDLGPRFFTVQYGTDSKTVEVNPTTGRVTSRKGS